MKTYHDTKTGKFVSKERVKNDPAGTVEVTSIDISKELQDFLKWYDDLGSENERIVGEYLKQK